MESSSLPYEVLDLALDGIETSELCRTTMKLLASARRVIVVAGAGISVAAGIPDFRSTTGLFSTLKADTKFKPSGKALFDASVYKVPPLMYKPTVRAKQEHSPTMK
jgi:NAD-dependent histone deacetylase SIR2